MGYNRLMDQDEIFLRQAIDLSRRNMAGQAGGPFGAVVVMDGKVVGQGWNRVTETHDPTAHAEVSAIRDACTRLGTHALEGAVLYTSCEPCPMCLATAYWARLARIVWGNTREDAAAIGFDDAFLYSEVALPPEKRALPTRVLLRDEARAVFASWAARPDKVMY
jgi:guanine deaminase